MWRRWGTPKNFFLAFIDELEKQIIIKKLLKWANKKQNNFNIYNVAFFWKKKIKKNTLRHHYQNLDDMIYSSWDIEQNILKLVILGHFLPFYPLKTPKIKILKNEKICWRYHRFTHVHQKPQSYDVWFLKYRQNFFVIWHIFCPFTSPSNDPEYQNFEKNEKNAWRYYPFIHTCVP